MSSPTLLLAKQRIAEKQATKASIDAKISALQQDMQKADMAIAAWEEVLHDLTATKSNGHLHNNVAPTVATVPIPNSSAAADSSDRRRGPRGVWKIVMPHMIGAYGTTNFSVSDLEQLWVHSTGSPLNSNTARSQIANYLKTGLIDRVGNGRYKFTQSGLDVFSSLSHTPDAETHPDTETPAVDDVQAAGVSSDDGTNINPETSGSYTATRDGESR